MPWGTCVGSACRHEHAPPDRPGRCRCGDRRGDRTRGREDAYTTPFTVLVGNLERFLPSEAWSKSAAACAKRIERIERSLEALRQNADAS